MSLNPSTEKIIEQLAQKLFNERKQNHKYDKNVVHLSSLASSISDKKNNTSKPNSRTISINDPSLLIKNNEITDNLKEFAKEIFNRCDSDKDGLLNMKEYNDYFHLIDMDPMDEEGVNFMFSCFGVEGNHKGLSLNDFYGFIRYLAMVDRQELIRSLNYVFGEENVLRKLTGENGGTYIGSSSGSSIPRKSLDEIPLMEGNEICQPLKDIAKDLFDKCDKDGDGILNGKEYNDYFALLDTEPLEGAGLSLMFLSFGVEGRGKGLSLNDLYGVYKFQIMTDKAELLRGLKYHFGEDNLIDRLTGNYHPEVENKSSKRSNVPRKSLDEIPLMDGDEICQPLKDIAKVLFDKCDKDGDGILNGKEYNDYFALLDTEPEDEAGLSLLFLSFGVEGHGKGLSLKDLYGVYKFQIMMNKADFLRGLKYHFGEDNLIDRLTGNYHPDDSTATRETKTNDNKTSKSNVPRKSLDEISLLDGNEISQPLKDIVKILFDKSDKDGDGILNGKEYNDYFALLDTEPMEEAGLSLMFLSFGVEGHGKGLSLKDLYGVYKFQIMTDKAELLRGLKYHFGEDNLIDRLTGNYHPDDDNSFVSLSEDSITNNNSTNLSKSSAPKKSLNEIPLIDGDEICQSLKDIAKDLFNKSDKDGDGILNGKEFNNYFALLDTEPMEESGLNLTFLSFGVDGKGKGLSLKDLYGFYKFQIMTDKDDFLRGLKYAYGENNLIDRLNGNFKPTSSRDNSTTSKNDSNNTNNKTNSNSSKTNASKKSLDEISLMDGNEICQPLKDIVKELFIKCDKDKDGKLNAKEYNDYFRLLDTEPMSESGLSLVFLSFGVEGKGNGLTLNDLYGVYKFQIMTDKEDVLRGLKYAYGEEHLIERLSTTNSPSSSTKNTNNNSSSSNKTNMDDIDIFNSRIKNFINNESNDYDTSSSSSKLDNKLINNRGNDIKDELKDMVNEIFYRFDKDKDKSLSIDEFWDFSRYCGMIFSNRSDIQKLQCFSGRNSTDLNSFYKFFYTESSEHQDDVINYLINIFGEEKVNEKLSLQSNLKQKSVPKKSINDIQLLNGNDIINELKIIAREIFIKCDQDRDGLLNSKEYNDYFRLIGMEMMDQNGLRIMFSSFGVEARGQGFTLNDFCGFIRFQAMSDRNELIRALTHVYGENNLIERLTSESSNDLNNVLPSEKMNQLILLNGNNDLTPAFKELIGQVFDRCDIDRDGLLNFDEFNEYFKIIGMDPMNREGLQMMFTSFGVEGRGQGFTKNDLFGFLRYQAFNDRRELIRALCNLCSERVLIKRLGISNTPAVVPPSVPAAVPIISPSSVPATPIVNNGYIARTINEVQFLNSNNDITDNLKQLITEMFVRCDLDRDGLLNMVEFNNYFRLIGVNAMDNNGIQMMFSRFGVEGRGQGFTINDLFAFIRYQASVDRRELIRALTYVFGEQNALNRLNGVANVNPTAYGNPNPYGNTTAYPNTAAYANTTNNPNTTNSNTSAYASTNTNANTNANTNSSVKTSIKTDIKTNVNTNINSRASPSISTGKSSSANTSSQSPSEVKGKINIKLLNGEELTSGLRELAIELFRRCDEDRDGILNIKEFGRYLAITKQFPMLPEGIQLIFMCYGVEADGEGLSLNDFLYIINYDAIFNSKTVLKSLITVFGEEKVINKLKI